MYQTEFRKPVHVVFCLDYSGSMKGEGISSLLNAMDYIFGNEASSSMIQFSKMDKVDVIIFNHTLADLETVSGDQVYNLMGTLSNYTPNGTTALFPSVVEAYSKLNHDEDYNQSIIVMTDGAGNVGDFSDVRAIYKKNNRQIPIYSITFGDASEEQLEDLAELSNGKVFDGRVDLVKAFKAVRGYN